MQKQQIAYRHIPVGYPENLVRILCTAERDPVVDLKIHEGKREVYSKEGQDAGAADRERERERERSFIDNQEVTQGR